MGRGGDIVLVAVIGAAAYLVFTGAGNLWKGVFGGGDSGGSGGGLIPSIINPSWDSSAPLLNPPGPVFAPSGDILAPSGDVFKPLGPLFNGGVGTWFGGIGSTGSTSRVVAAPPDPNVNNFVLKDIQANQTNLGWSGSRPPVNPAGVLVAISKDRPPVRP